jgi:hypothetical protein
VDLPAPCMPVTKTAVPTTSTTTRILSARTEARTDYRPRHYDKAHRTASVHADRGRWCRSSCGNLVSLHRHEYVFDRGDRLPKQVSLTSAVRLVLTA